MATFSDTLDELIRARDAGEIPAKEAEELSYKLEKEYYAGGFDDQPTPEESASWAKQNERPGFVKQVLAGAEAGALPYVKKYAPKVIADLLPDQPIVKAAPPEGILENIGYGIGKMAAPLAGVSAVMATPVGALPLAATLGIGSAMLGAHAALDPAFKVEHGGEYVEPTSGERLTEFGKQTAINAAFGAIARPAANLVRGAKGIGFGGASKAGMYASQAVAEAVPQAVYGAATAPEGQRAEEFGTQLAMGAILSPLGVGKEWKQRKPMLEQARALDIAGAAKMPTHALPTAIKTAQDLRTTVAGQTRMANLQITPADMDAAFGEYAEYLKKTQEDMTARGEKPTPEFADELLTFGSTQDPIKLAAVSPLFSSFVSTRKADGVANRTMPLDVVGKKSAIDLGEFFKGDLVIPKEEAPVVEGGTAPKTKKPSAHQQTRELLESIDDEKLTAFTLNKEGQYYNLAKSILNKRAKDAKTVASLIQLPETAFKAMADTAQPGTPLFDQIQRAAAERAKMPPPVETKTAVPPVEAKTATPPVEAAATPPVETPVVETPVVEAAATPPVETPAAPTPPVETPAVAPVKHSKKTISGLKERGFTDEEIGKIPPAQAKALLATPIATPKTEEVVPNAEGPAQAQGEVLAATPGTKTEASPPSTIEQQIAKLKSNIVFNTESRDALVASPLQTERYNKRIAEDTAKIAELEKQLGAPPVVQRVQEAAAKQSAPPPITVESAKQRITVQFKDGASKNGTWDGVLTKNKQGRKYATVHFDDGTELSVHEKQLRPFKAEETAPVETTAPSVAEEVITAESKPKRTWTPEQRAKHAERIKAKQEEIAAEETRLAELTKIRQESIARYNEMSTEDLIKTYDNLPEGGEQRVLVDTVLNTRSENEGQDVRKMAREEIARKQAEADKEGEELAAFAREEEGESVPPAEEAPPKVELTAEERAALDAETMAMEPHISAAELELDAIHTSKEKVTKGRVVTLARTLREAGVIDSSDFDLVSSAKNFDDAIAELEDLVSIRRGEIDNLKNPDSFAVTPENTPRPKQSFDRAEAEAIIRRVMGREDHGFDLYDKPGERTPWGRIVRGYYKDGVKGINLAEMTDAAMVERIAKHEFTHEQIASTKGQELLIKFVRKHLDWGTLAKTAKDYPLKRVKDGDATRWENETEYSHRVVGEYLAKLSETRTKSPVWKQLVQRVKEFLNATGLRDLTLKEAEEAILWRLSKIKGGEKGPSDGVLNKGELSDQENRTGIPGRLAQGEGVVEARAKQGTGGEAASAGRDVQAYGKEEGAADLKTQYALADEPITEATKVTSRDKVVLTDGYLTNEAGERIKVYRGESVPHDTTTPGEPYTQGREGAAFFSTDPLHAAAFTGIDIFGDGEPTNRAMREKNKLKSHPTTFSGYINGNNIFDLRPYYNENHILQYDKLPDDIKGWVKRTPGEDIDTRLRNALRWKGYDVLINKAFNALEVQVFNPDQLRTPGKGPHYSLADEPVTEAAKAAAAKPAPDRTYEERKAVVQDGIMKNVVAMYNDYMNRPVDDNGFFRSAIRELLPGALSEQHLRAAEWVGSLLGKKNHSLEVATPEFEPIRDYWAKAKVGDKKTPLAENPGMLFASRMQMGRLNEMTPEQREMVKVFDKHMKPLYESALKTIIDDPHMSTEKIAAMMLQDSLRGVPELAKRRGEAPAVYQQRVNKAAMEKLSKIPGFARLPGEKKYSDYLERIYKPLTEMYLKQQLKRDYFPTLWTKESVSAFHEALQNLRESRRDPENPQHLPEIDILSESPEVKKEFLADVEAIKKRGAKMPANNDAVAAAFLKRPMEGSKGFLKHRYFDDIMDGIGLGLEPFSTNPVDLIQHKRNELAQFVVGRTIRNSAAYIPIGVHTDRPGWRVPKDRNFTLTTSQAQGSQVIGRYYLPNAQADIVDAYTSSSLYNHPVGFISKGYKKTMRWGSLLNQVQLGMGSFFHAGFMYSEAGVSSGANLLKDIYRVAAGKGTHQVGKSFKEYALSYVPGTAYKHGNKLLDAYYKGTTDPLMEKIVKAFELGGGRFEMERGLTTNDLNKFKEDWYGGNYKGAAGKSLTAISERLGQFIMKQVVPHHKAAVFTDLAERIIRDNPGKTLEQLTPEFRQAVNRIDARLGQVGYDRLFMNNAAKNAIQLLIRAPGWTGGTIAEIGGGVFKDVPKFFMEWKKTGKLPEQLPDRVAYSLSLMMTMSVVNGLMTYLFTGEQPTDEDFWAFRTGDKDEKGRPERFVWPTYGKDVKSYLEDYKSGTPMRTLGHKVHPMWSALNQAIKNKDFEGAAIRDYDESWPKRVADLVKFGAKQYTPFWMTGVGKEYEREGGMPTTGKEALKMAAPFVGITQATGAYTKSRAEKMITDYMGDSERSALMPEQKERYDDRMAARRDLIIRNDPTKLNELRRAGRLTAEDVKDIRKNRNEAPIVYSFKHSGLNIKEAFNVYEAATPEEKKLLRRLMIVKYQNARKNARAIDRPILAKRYAEVMQEE